MGNIEERGIGPKAAVLTKEKPENTKSHESGLDLKGRYQETDQGARF